MNNRFKIEDLTEYYDGVECKRFKIEDLTKYYDGVESFVSDDELPDLVEI
jgi:hypothetical protein